MPKLSLLLVVLLVATVGEAAPRSAAAEIGSDFIVVKSKHRASGEFLGAKKSDADDDEEAAPPKRTKVRRAVEHDDEERPTRRNLEGRS